ncbi:MAG: Crp/Fnr family transcriptional regulator [Oscillospiraceae bacterium]|nr:Crp/Fnr family transcriptional regulator [Oscillospiraceae bacterium]
MDVSALSDRELSLLAGCFLFQDADSSFLSRAVGDGRCTLRVYEKGAVIFEPARFSRGLGVLLSGAVLVTKSAAAHGYVMRRIAPGGVFGAAALFDDGPYVSVLKAERPCRMIFFPQALVEELLRESPEAALGYIRFLSGRVRFLNGRIAALLSDSAESSVAGYLLGAGENPVRCGSLTEMSARLNIGRTSLYRALGSLQERGVIKKDGKSVEILDAAALKLISSNGGKNT